MSRTAVAAVVAIAVAALVAPVAAAEQPIRVPAEGPSFTLSAAVCGFPVQVETVTNKEVVTIFGDGRILVTGALKVRLTNASDPAKSLVFNIPGPALIAADGTFHGMGPWLLFQEPNPLAPEGMLAYVTGRFVLQLGTEPNTFTLEQQGETFTSLCGALA